MINSFGLRQFNVNAQQVPTFQWRVPKAALSKIQFIENGYS